MKDQTKRRGVEAAGVTAHERAALRARGEEFDQHCRALIRTVAHSGQQVPAPRQFFYDLGRVDDRPASIASIGMAFAALAQSRWISDSDFYATAEAVATWIRSLRPVTTESLACCWERETRAQAEADVAQARALRALETRDLPALDAAISETADHSSEVHRILDLLMATRRDVTNVRRDSMHVLRPELRPQ